ncbi:GPW/gp25 family protein [Stenotrophomonas sp. MMGLT7]|uniref:GPW/gp25 family protein n=1 Tax=Stenotrophomonas sp. MMGLT7 TaxID=2901227 RepID=UPI001E371697|nr:GPW/gp25 family protein [Stenotrophomonas sp. MMGLT7]
MRGMSATTGQALEGTAHLAQSIADILTTPIGTRVMRRDYGSLLPELIDQPFNGATVTRIYGAIAGALMRWEQRLRITRLSIAAGAAAGQFAVTIEGNRTDVPPASEFTRITVPLNFR